MHTVCNNRCRPTNMRNATTLLEVLDGHAAAHADRPHVLLDSGGAKQVLSYGELQARSRCVAAHLCALGLQPTQCVAIMLPTCLEFFHTFFGALRAGLVPVPLCPPANWIHLEDHLCRQAGILTNCRAPILVTSPAAKLFARLLRARAPTLRHIVTAEQLLATPPAYTSVPVNAQSVALLQYTSGSTASPKGVVLTHANLLANIRAFSTAIDLNAAEVCVSWLPLYHDMGLIGAWLGCAYSGARLVLMSPQYFLARPHRWLSAIHQYRGTVSAAPNFAFEFCVRKIPEHELRGLDLSSWRWAGNGAEPVSAETVRRFTRRFAACGFRAASMVPVYGLAECGLALTVPPRGRTPQVDRVRREPLTEHGRALPLAADDPSAMSCVSCGAPLAGYELRIVDGRDHELPERNIGHVQFRGPSATCGYRDNEPATRQLRHGDWLDSGDLGYVAQGELYLTGRAKDVMICNGRKLCPYELEESIGNLSGVRRGCVTVFGAAVRDRASDGVVVVAETRIRDAARRQQLTEQVRALSMRLLGISPCAILWVPLHTVLKSSSGKLRRSAMKEMYERGALASTGSSIPRQFFRIAVQTLVGSTRRTLNRHRSHQRGPRFES